MTTEFWAEQQIGDLISSAESGLSLLGESRAADEGEAAILTLSSVSDGLFRPNQYKVVSSTDGRQLATSPKQDRILISRSNTPDLVGAAVYVDRDWPNRFLPDLIWQLEPNSAREFSVRWLCYWLQSPIGRGAIRRIAAGSSGSMVKISRERFFKIPIKVPPLRQQYRIAEILAQWDSAIELIEKFISVTETRKRGLMHALLAGERRLPAFADTQWTKQRLGNLFAQRCETGRTDLPLLSITSKGGVVPRGSLDRRDTSNDDKSKYLRIRNGDIGYNTMRMWQGVSAVSELEGIVSPAYTICVPHEDVDPHFMGYLFKYPPVIHLFKRHSQGLVDDTLSLKFDAFSKIEVSVPPIDEQGAIAQVLKTCDNELALLVQKLALLKQQKQGLMQQLLTGKVRVLA